MQGCTGMREALEERPRVLPAPTSFLAGTGARLATAERATTDTVLRAGRAAWTERCCRAIIVGCGGARAGGVDMGRVVRSWEAK
jgi:hypothetical protein